MTKQTNLESGRLLGTLARAARTARLLQVAFTDITEAETTAFPTPVV